MVKIANASVTSKIAKIVSEKTQKNHTLILTIVIAIAISIKKRKNVHQINQISTLKNANVSAHLELKKKILALRQHHISMK